MKNHVFFSGIGGTGIGPLALIAHQAGFKVTGSDMKKSQYTDYLEKQGIDLYIGQSEEAISKVHKTSPIDWFVYSSALPKDHAELRFAIGSEIKTTKRDDFINVLLDEKQLSMFAVAGTHGKTTTTAMSVWLFKELGKAISYSVGAKISFGEMGSYVEGSTHFIYECDEFDRNFLAYRPRVSLITGVTWDHHEIFPTREDYKDAFRTFINQSKLTYLWRTDAEYLTLLSPNDSLVILENDDPVLKQLTLFGEYNRRDATLVAHAVHHLIGVPLETIIDILNQFPGTQRRMELILPGLYSDYAHTPEKIVGCMSVAMEIANKDNKRVVVVYEPLTNRRQHYMKQQYQDCFIGAHKLYWVPSFLAREDPNQEVLTPQQLIPYMKNHEIAEAAELDEKLKEAILKHLEGGDIVVAMSGGGAGSLDEWLRREFKQVS